MAGRAGTNTPAIYRRWPTKVHLVHEAAFPDELASLETTGDVRADLEGMVRATAQLFSDPVVRAALPGLVSDLHPHPKLHREPMGRLWLARVDELQEQLDGAADAGLIRGGVQAEHLLGVIGGSALLSVLTPGFHELDDAWVAAVAALVLEGITP